MLHVIRHPNGPRVWIFGQRVHHGMTGCLLLAWSAKFRRRRRLIAGLGLALCAHDRADWRAWFAREPLSAR